MLKDWRFWRPCNPKQSGWWSECYLPIWLWQVAVLKLTMGMPSSRLLLTWSPMAHTGLSFPCHLRALRKLVVDTQMVKSKLFGRRKTTFSLLSEKADQSSQQEVLVPEETKPSPVPTVPWELPHAFHVPLSAHQAHPTFSTSWDPTRWNSHIFSFCEHSRSHLGRIP